MSKNINRDELVRVATGALAGAIAGITGGIAQAAVVKGRTGLLVELAAELIENVDAFYDQQEDLNVELSLERDDPDFEQPPIVDDKETI